MSRPPQTAPRYRRRILLVGMAAALVLFCIGFPIYNNRIEADLERRLPDELAEAGFPGITASFSGQDGTLRCAEPLTDPEAATEAAYDVWGVRKITLDRRCRVNRAPVVSDSSADDSAESANAGAESTAGVAASTTAASQHFATLADAVASAPDLSFLGVLLQESGLTDQLGDAAAEPVTIFAPTDAAFDALSADVSAQLRSDTDLLAHVLARHVVAGELFSSDLASGRLTTMDGSTIFLAVGGSSIIIDGGATVTRPDVATGNGIIHVIDQVLLPGDLDVPTDELPAAAAATFDAGTLTFTGVVASEVERATLLNAGVAAAGAGKVADQLTVDPDTGLDAVNATNLASLVTAMPVHLVSGVSGFDGTGLYVEGVYVSDAARDAMTAAADAVEAAATLVPRPEATAADAAALETQLNEFVAANPVRFEPAAAVLTADAEALLDQLAAQALAFGGVTITIEGHTDSDGDPDANLSLSQQRAETVLAALVARGLVETSLTAEGFGETQPVLVGGVEDKDASRRVEFRIEATA
jgi:OOP family OmpA-OmpF porin